MPLASVYPRAFRCAFPGIDLAGHRFPDAGLLRSRQFRDRPVFRRHGDPLIGLGQDGVLAGDGVAHHGEPVTRADGEGKKAVEVLDGGLERLLEARALAEAMGQIAGRDL